MSILSLDTLGNSSNYDGPKHKFFDFHNLIYSSRHLHHPYLANYPPKNASMEEIWRDAVRRGSILYDQMQSGCFPDKRNPITFSELVAQNWTVNDAAGPEIQFPPRPQPPHFSPSVAKMMPWTKGNDYYGTSLKHHIGTFLYSPELISPLVKSPLLH